MIFTMKWHWMGAHSMRTLKCITALGIKYRRNEDGVAAVEAAFVFPVLLVLLLGVLDMGRGIMCNQKTIRASQVVADLITREVSVDDGGVNEAINAGTLAMLPYDDTNLAFDVISVRFTSDDEAEIVWQETRNMAATPQNQVLERVLPLAVAGSGVVMVVSEYLYEPIFAGFVVDQIPMQEVAFARGRRSAVVCKDGAPGCSS
jgi:Flp pilus assembly protein TadG